MDLLLSFHTAGPLPNLFLTSTLCHFLPLVLSGFAAPLSRKSGLGPLPGHPLAPRLPPHVALRWLFLCPRAKALSGQDRGCPVGLCPCPSPSPSLARGQLVAQKHLCPEERSSQSLEKRHRPSFPCLVLPGSWFTAQLSPFSHCVTGQITSPLYSFPRTLSRHNLHTVKRTNLKSVARLILQMRHSCITLINLYKILPEASLPSQYPSPGVSTPLIPVTIGKLCLPLNFRSTDSIVQTSQFL